MKIFLTVILGLAIIRFLAEFAKPNRTLSEVIALLFWVAMEITGIVFVWLI